VHGELILKKESCTSCHHIKREDCQGCHPVQDEFRQGFKLLDYDSIPAPMADLGCKDCHSGIEFQQTSRIVRDACVNCHDKDYIQILEEQQQEIKKRMQETRDFISQLEGKKKLGSEQQKRIDYIRERLDLMEEDKSSGGHNYNLNRRMLEDIKRVIEDSGG
jgi:hypothetical protein